MKDFLRKIAFGLIDIFIMVIAFPILRVFFWFSDLWEEFKGKKNND